MKLFTRWVNAAILLQATTVFAEPVTVPHTFTPGTPAKSADVNANIQALAAAIQGIKSVGLYQNSVKIGKSALLNVVQLNSGYLVLPVKFNTSSNIYVTGDGGSKTALYYATNNCSGTSFFPKTLEVDLLSSATGVVTAISNQTFSMTLPATKTSNFFYNSYKIISTGICYNVSMFQTYTTIPSCASEYSSDPSYYDSQGYTRGRDVKYTPNNSHSCEWLNYAFSSNPYTGTGYSPVRADLVKPKGNAGGILPKAYPIQLNNPFTTGITTMACTNSDGEPAVCVTNGELRSE